MRGANFILQGACGRAQNSSMINYIYITVVEFEMYGICTRANSSISILTIETDCQSKQGMKTTKGNSFDVQQNSNPQSCFILLVINMGDIVAILMGTYREAKHGVKISKDS